MTYDEWKANIGPWPTARQGEHQWEPACDVRVCVQCGKREYACLTPYCENWTDTGRYCRRHSATKTN
jgi:hypothetical protein